MNPVTKKSSDRPRQSARAAFLIAVLVCVSIASITNSSALVSEYRGIFQSAGMNPFGNITDGTAFDLGTVAGASVGDDDTDSFPKSGEEFEHEQEDEGEGESATASSRSADDESRTEAVKESDEKVEVESTRKSDQEATVADDGKGPDEEASNKVEDGKVEGEGNSDEKTSVAGTNEAEDASKIIASGENVDGPATNKDDDRRRMNVLVLFPDDWRYNSIGKENTIVQTPFLDSLADDGIHFRQNAVTTSICWQSRATLFSGQWAARHQSYKLRCPHFAKGRRWNQTWPVLLKNDGYFVGHVGKWQYHSDQTDRFEWQSYHEGKHWYRRGRKYVAAEDVAKDDAIRFLKERPKEKPFAMTVAFYPPKPVSGSTDPGGQWTPKPEYRAIYENITIPEPYNMTHAFSLLPLFLQRDRSAAADRWRRRYSTPFHYQEAMKNIYALITQVDEASRQIVDEIKAQGLYNNTMIIFTTDNGMFHGSHGLAGKWYPYQESIRVPLIIHDPRMPSDKVGAVDENFTLNVDLASTILGAAGLKPHERMQGRDISDLYLPNRNEENGKTALEMKPWRDEFFYEFTFFDENFIPSSNALVRKKWKYIHWPHKNFEQLFNLEDDPMEFTDVSDDPANAEILAEMRKRMNEEKDLLSEPEDKKLACSGGNWSVNPPDEQ